jgi:hypothetical protein
MLICTSLYQTSRYCISLGISCSELIGGGKTGLFEDQAHLVSRRATVLGIGALIQSLPFLVSDDAAGGAVS